LKYLAASDCAPAPNTLAAALLLSSFRNSDFDSFFSVTNVRNRGRLMYRQILVFGFGIGGSVFQGISPEFIEQRRSYMKNRDDQITFVRRLDVKSAAVSESGVRLNI
jgi:hypothetical protein